MKIGKREFGLGKGGRLMNKVSISTITTGVPSGRVPAAAEGPRVMGVGAPVGEVEKVIKVKEGAKVTIVRGAGAEVSAEPGGIRVMEVPVEEKEEFMGEGLTSPW